MEDRTILREFPLHRVGALLGSEVTSQGSEVASQGSEVANHSTVWQRPMELGEGEGVIATVTVPDLDTRPEPGGVVVQDLKEADTDLDVGGDTELGPEGESEEMEVLESDQLDDAPNPAKKARLDEGEGLASETAVCTSQQSSEADVVVCA